MADSNQSQLPVRTRMRLWVNNVTNSIRRSPSTLFLSKPSASTPSLVDSMKYLSATSLVSPPFPFLRLPGEIRNHVYHYVLYSEHVALIAVYYYSPRDTRSTLLSSPVFQLNRQIRAEALAFLCSAKKFRIYGVQSATIFFRSITPLGVSNLTNITLALSEPKIDVDADVFFQALRTAKLLRRMTVLLLRIFDKEADRASPFFRDLKEVVDEMDGLTFKWCVALKAGTLGPTSYTERVQKMIKELGEVLGKENWDVERAMQGKLVWQTEYS